MGYVYLLWQKDSCLYKIGKADTLTNLIANRKTYNGSGLDYIASIEVTNHAELEKRLHKKWKGFHKHCEWFSIPPTHIFDLFQDFNYLPENVEKKLKDMIAFSAYEGIRYFLNLLPSPLVKRSDAKVLFKGMIQLNSAKFDSLTTNYVKETLDSFGVPADLVSTKRMIDESNGVVRY